ncbi:related to U3 small nucleolar RNA-associated protein 18 [Saccharomycodes ludwigii]|uniref:Related to U3 small nucleolar RNA-associated protein 18 n=1 Tax=Saccharomycodes ludwigii TaxID=36035 RepID=A0A376B1W6_9ASCO|nr:related to U3 small nucleolar RNA-associated protein 18 [Saccharomycodes ludwigii]
MDNINTIKEYHNDNVNNDLAVNVKESDKNTETSLLQKQSPSEKNIPPPDKEELLLNKLVFGETADDFRAGLKDTVDSFQDYAYNSNSDDDNDSISDAEDKNEDEMDLLNDDQLFYADEDGEEDDEHRMDVDYESSSTDDESDAWVDSDDENVNINLWDSNRSKKLKTSYVEKSLNGKEYIKRLRAQFEKIYPIPRWVYDIEQNSDTEYNSEEDNEESLVGDVNALIKILNSSTKYTDKKSGKHSSKLLPPNKIELLRVKDANAQHPSRAAIQTLSFHPSNQPILLTGGYDRSLRLYHIDGRNNPLVTSVYLHGTPIQTACIYVNNSDPDTTKVFTGGRRRYMHSWTISNGDNQNENGQLNIEKISRMYGHESTQRSFENFKMGHYLNSNGYNTKNSTSSHGIICLQGNNGWINILHATTGQYMTGCKIEGVLIDFCIDYLNVINNDGKEEIHTIIIAINTFGQVWEFDLNDDNKVINKWKDESGVGITKIQVGGATNSSYLLSSQSNNESGSGIRCNNRWLAIGSESGIVTVYDRYNKGSSKPSFILDQLTTTISNLEFSHDGQLLCMASRSSKDALKLVHLSTGSVFSNWPNSRTPLGRVTCVKFSPRSEYLAVGNEQGRVRLWKLGHYC